MFNLKDFVKGGLLKAVGNMTDYQIILNAAGWLEKGVLTEDDLAEIDEAIKTHESVTVPENILQPSEIGGE
jgi:hypothetical protein